MADAKLSALPEVTGGPLGTDWFYFIRPDGNSPVGYTSYHGRLSEIPGVGAYDVPLSYSGTPGVSALLGKVMIVRDVLFPANFSGSSGHVGANPAATFAIDVQDDGASIGTISISTGGTFTFTTVGGVSKTVAAGSRLEFYAPANSPAEASISNIAATLKGSI